MPCSLKGAPQLAPLIQIASMFNRQFALCIALAFTQAFSLKAFGQVRTNAGMVEGAAASNTKVRAFKGIPYAAAPIGDLRWKPPQPVAAWDGVRKSTEFGARCMQGRIFDDMVFRDPGPSENCLNLNVWTPAASANEHLPVMVWIYGGGFQAGSSSEPRQDGQFLAQKGVVVVSLNYRLGVFGFFSHPELTAESPNHASGNYGLMDQAAALHWVHENIAAFGGDPGNVTIFGESAGSFSVSAQMASPLARDLFKQVIGESGSVYHLDPRTPSLSKAEQVGEKFANSIGAISLRALRAKPADQVLESSLKEKGFPFWMNVDGYFFPESPSAIFAAGKQAHVALLAGWNADESGYEGFLEKTEPTAENYAAKVRERYPEHAADILKLYPGRDEKQVKESARDLAGDRFIGYSTWRWLDAQLATGGSPVYRYHFEQAPPQPTGQPSHGAYHSADIEYVFETLDSKSLPWTPDDRKLSDMISSYWSNFAKTGNPNGPGLAQWAPYKSDDGYKLMHLKARSPKVGPDSLRARYELLSRIAGD